MTSTHPRSTRFVTLVSAALVGGGWLAACGSSVDPQTTSSATAGTGGSGGAASTCDAPQLLCDGACLDARFDPSNCGACGNACSGDEVCSDGKCGLQCSGGTSKCEVGGQKRCVDLQVDASNCGACGNACGTGEVCSQGACALGCSGGTTQCETKCVDVQLDPSHCGGCGNACPTGMVCQQGLCLTNCVGGTAKCSIGGVDVCIDADNDPSHCGGCGVPCSAVANGNAVCVAGECSYACTPGFADCDSVEDTGCEVSVLTDTNHCGSCGADCSTLVNSNPKCDAGACAIESCVEGYDDCDADTSTGCETDLQTDASNCGKCGTLCAAGQVCLEGSCVKLTFASCKARKQALPASPDGLYMIDPDGDGGNPAFQVYCDMTRDGGGWTRCLEFVNTAVEDVNNNTWFNNCVDWSMAAWTGTELFVKLDDANDTALYAEQGSRLVTWTYEQLTSTAETGSQFEAANHERLVTLSNGDKLMIAGRTSGNGGCGGSMGNGYGIVIYPANPNYYFNPKMFVFPYRHQVGDTDARHFGAFGGPKWSVEHEIIYAANSFNSCETVPATGTLGTFEFYVR